MTLSKQVIKHIIKSNLKKYIQMFRQLYVVSQVRGRNIQEPFNYKTRKGPTSLAKAGDIRGRVKADLLSCVKREVVSAHIEPWAKTAVLEGFVLVNIEKPGND